MPFFPSELVQLLTWLGGTGAGAAAVTASSTEVGKQMTKALVERVKRLFGAAARTGAAARAQEAEKKKAKKTFEELVEHSLKLATENDTLRAKVRELEQKNAKVQMAKAPRKRKSKRKRSRRSNR
jgi:regulator of replication initiation timing